MDENQNQMEMSIFGVGPTGMRIFTIDHERIKKINYDRQHFKASTESICFIYILLY
jgi:hypothetical protein